MTETPLAVIEQILASGKDADDVLRGVVAALVEHGGCSWAGILFVEEGALVLGPEAGDPQPGARTQLPVVFQGDRVAEVVADGCADVAFLARVAEILAPYCLVGWDTGGVSWDAVS
jgi:putative methionine-R-sulfoxide reductase with GAF domain